MERSIEACGMRNQFPLIVRSRIANCGYSSVNCVKKLLYPQGGEKSATSIWLERRNRRGAPANRCFTRPSVGRGGFSPESAFHRLIGHSRSFLDP